VPLLVSDDVKVEVAVLARVDVADVDWDDVCDEDTEDVSVVVAVLETDEVALED
jgi:hypothetical protein